MEYRIKEQHRLKGITYFNPTNERKEAEGNLKEIITNNTDQDAVYTVVYGQNYPQGANNGTFAEFPEPKNA